MTSKRRALVLLGRDSPSLSLKTQKKIATDSLDAIVRTGWSSDVLFTDSPFGNGDGNGNILAQILGISAADSPDLKQGWYKRVGNMAMSLIKIKATNEEKFEAKTLHEFMHCVPVSLPLSSASGDQLASHAVNMWSSGSEMVIIDTLDMEDGGITVLEDAAAAVLKNDEFEMYTAIVVLDDGNDAQKEAEIIPGVKRPIQSSSQSKELEFEPRMKVCCHALMAASAPEVARKDSLESLSALFREGACCGGVAACHVAAEIAFILGKTPKFGA